MALLPNALAWMLKTAGTPCSAVIDGEYRTFNGVLNNQTFSETDETGNPVVFVGTSITVLTTLADELDSGARVKVGATEYQVRDKMLMSDGTITQLVVVRA